MRYEAKFLSNINVSDVNPRSYDSKQVRRLKIRLNYSFESLMLMHLLPQSRFVAQRTSDFAPCPPALVPDKDWQEEFIRSFELLKTVRSIGAGMNFFLCVCVHAGASYRNSRLPKLLKAIRQGPRHYQNFEMRVRGERSCLGARDQRQRTQNMPRRKRQSQLTHQRSLFF